MPSNALPLLAQNWFAAALTSELSLLCAGIILTCLLLLAMLIRAVVRLGRSARLTETSADTSSTPARPATAMARLATFFSDARGTTSIEFALVFPILLTLCLLLTQTMMMMAGNMYIHYAAFQATRHATMEVPQDYTDRGDLGANYYSPGSSSIKHERIRRAAYMAMVPVAGQLGSSGGAGSAEMTTSMTSLFSAYGASEPAWVSSMLAAKVAYAEANTEIELLETLVHPDDDVTFDPLPENPYRFGVRDVITVRVIHKLNLGVPVVSRLFADGNNGAKGPGRYSLITARATLTNEGVPTALPEKPDIDRVTPTLSPILNNNPNGINNFVP